MLKMHHKQAGGALLYILIAIGLIAALTVSLSGNTGSLSNTQNAAKLKMELKSHIEYMRNAINECVLNYPDGDPTINVASTTDSNYIAPYPLTPNSSHFTGSTLGVAASHSAEYLRCPGNPGIDNNHTPLFGGASGKTYPPVHPVVGTWYYKNRTTTFAGETVAGVYIRFGTNKTDNYIKLALSELAAEYGTCEADYIIGDGTNGCASDTTCFRIWIVRPNGC